MPKRNETIEIENALSKETKEKRIYGCEEVTIGFPNGGMGNEIVDFMTMNSKGIIKCYEIKVTMADLKSNAKKSWYGHYNYLVIGGDLLKKLDEVKEITPAEIGILDSNLKSIRKTKLQKIDEKISVMLKESLIRSIYFKMNKYKSAQDINEHKLLKLKLQKAEKEMIEFRNKYNNLSNDVWRYEQYLRRHKGIDFCLKDEIKKIKENKF